MKRLWLPALLMLLGSTGRAAEPAMGVVQSVTADGELIVSMSGVRTTYALGNIMLPEVGDPYRVRSIEIVRAQLQGQTVTLVPTGTAPSSAVAKRVLVYVAGHPFNVDMIKRGHAWVDTRQTRNSAMLRFQSDARMQQLGMFEGNVNKEGPKALKKAVRAKEKPPLAQRLADMNKLIAENAHKVFIGYPALGVYWPMTCKEALQKAGSGEHVIFTFEGNSSKYQLKRADKCTPNSMARPKKSTAALN